MELKGSKYCDFFLEQVQNLIVKKIQSNSNLGLDSPEWTALIPQKTQLFETEADPASEGRNPPHTAQYKTQGHFHIAAIFQHRKLHY